MHSPSVYRDVFGVCASRLLAGPLAGRARQTRWLGPPSFRDRFNFKSARKTRERPAGIAVDSTADQTVRLNAEP